MEAKLIKFLEESVELYNTFNEQNPVMGTTKWGYMAMLEREFTDIGKILKCNIRYDDKGNARIEW